MEEYSAVATQSKPQPTSIITANDINQAHELVVRCASRLLDTGNEFVKKAAECGLLLIEKKAELGHGNWLPWLAKYCPMISHDTAARYIRTANFARERNLTGASSIRQALAILEYKSESERHEREKPPFAIRCVFNVEPETLDIHQRRDAFEQAKPLLQAFEAFGFIQIKSA